jgi:hypothetical protein
VVSVYLIKGFLCPYQSYLKMPENLKNIPKNLENLLNRNKRIPMSFISVFLIKPYPVVSVYLIKGFLCPLSIEPEDARKPEKTFLKAWRTSWRTCSVGRGFRSVATLTW